MNTRWPPYPEPAARSIRRLQRAILRLEPPNQACFVSIANAIEVQIEDGVDPGTLRHLLRAPLSCAKAVEISASALGMPGEDVDAIIRKIQP